MPPGAIFPFQNTYRDKHQPNNRSIKKQQNERL
jgi:hypothetical protein